MDKRLWLERSRDLDKEISALKLAKERAYGDALRITRNPDAASVRSGKGHHGGSYEDAVARVCDYEDMIEERMVHLYSMKREIQQAIDKIEEPRFRALLINRYINNMNWEKIAIEMSYSYDYVKKELHESALNAFELPIVNTK